MGAVWRSPVVLLGAWGGPSGPGSFGWTECATAAKDVGWVVPVSNSHHLQQT